MVYINTDKKATFELALAVLRDNADGRIELEGQFAVLHPCEGGIATCELAVENMLSCCDGEYRRLKTDGIDTISVCLEDTDLTRQIVYGD